MELKERKEKKCINKGIGTNMFLLLIINRNKYSRKKYLSLYQHRSKEERYETLNS
jgi:hypothetical protein